MHTLVRQNLHVRSEQFDYTLHTKPTLINERETKKVLGAVAGITPVRARRRQLQQEQSEQNRAENHPSSGTQGPQEHPHRA